MDEEMKAHKVMLKTTDVMNNLYVKLTSVLDDRVEFFKFSYLEVSQLTRNIGNSIHYGILDDKDFYK